MYSPSGDKWSDDIFRAHLKRAKEFRSLPGTENLTLIAHRGMGPSSLLGPKFAPTDAIPENTLEAFSRAILLGADGVELDIFKSKDGHIMVIHDDELWRNVYDVARNGTTLPSGETPQNYRVSQKTLAELRKLSVGPSREKIPTLVELFDLAKRANVIRKQEGLPPLILNIELKDATATHECLDLIIDYMKKNPGSGVDFNSICFCSFNHPCLITLKQLATEKNIHNIQIAPGIKTATLFGKDNVNPDFTIKAGAVYDEKGLAELQRLVEGHDFTAYDAVLWDIEQPLVDVARSGGKQLHASTSDFRQYDADPAFSEFLLKMSQTIPIYFKCDEIAKARNLLMNIAIAREKVRQARSVILAELSGHTNTSAPTAPSNNPPPVILKHMPKPTPYSTIINTKKSIEEALNKLLKSQKKPLLSDKSAIESLRRQLEQINRQLEPSTPATAVTTSTPNHPPMAASKPQARYQLPTTEQVMQMNIRQLQVLKKEIEERRNGLAVSKMQPQDAPAYKNMLTFIAECLEKRGKKPPVPPNVPAAIAPPTQTGVPRTRTEAQQPNQRPPVATIPTQPAAPTTAVTITTTKPADELPTQAQIGAMDREQLLSYKVKIEERLSTLSRLTVSIMSRINKQVYVETLKHIQERLDYMQKHSNDAQALPASSSASSALPPRNRSEPRRSSTLIMHARSPAYTLPKLVDIPKMSQEALEIQRKIIKDKIDGVGTAPLKGSAEKQLYNAALTAIETRLKDFLPVPKHAPK